MRNILTLITILALLLVACGDDDTGGDTTTTSTTTTVTTTETTTTTEPPTATCRQAPGDQPFEEVADGDIVVYEPGRYRVDQFDPMTHFTIVDEWSISDDAVQFFEYSASTQPGVSGADGNRELVLDI